MVIKTITSHDVYNFGASLQAYALMKYLSELGHDVENINYKPDYLNYNLWQIGPRWNKNFVIKAIFYSYVVPKRLSLKKNRLRFDKFTKERLRLTANKYSSNEDLKTDPPLADIFFAGSDQIWNTYSDNGKDPSFFLDFAPSNSIRASYAASFSTSDIHPDYVSQVKGWLEKFNFISVREQTGLEILQNLGFNDFELVLDPVFLLNRDSWADISNFELKNKDKYIFIYDQENNSNIRQAANELSKKHNLKIVAIENLYPMYYANKRVKDAGPEEFLGLIMNSEICLTNSFHCIAFCLIFNKKFLLFPRTHQNVNSRMVDLLSSFDLSNRIINYTDEIHNVPKIDYPAVNEKIKNRIIKSKNYIDRVLMK